MEEFVSNLYTNAYNELTERYHRDINDLESKKRSVGDVASRFDLTFSPPVHLPEFETQEVVFDSGITDVQYLQEDFMLVYTREHIYNACVSTGAIRQAARHDLRERYYQYKTVTQGGLRYDETDFEIILPDANEGFMCLYARDKEGRVQAHRMRDHLLSHNEVFRFENELWLGDHCVRSLCNVATGETTAFFIAEGYQMLFRYRDEWYEYGGETGQRKVWHCRSRTLQLYTWEDKHIHVQGDTIVLSNEIRNGNVLQILRPRRAYGVPL